MRTVTSLVCVLLLIMSVTNCLALERFRRDPEYYPLEVLDFLEKLEDALHIDTMHKRRMDAGFGGRTGAAMNLGSKLLAHHFVSDYSAPGKK